MLAADILAPDQSISSLSLALDTVYLAYTQFQLAAVAATRLQIPGLGSWRETYMKDALSQDACLLAETAVAATRLQSPGLNSWPENT